MLSQDREGQKEARAVPECILRIALLRSAQQKERKKRKKHSSKQDDSVYRSIILTAILVLGFGSVVLDWCSNRGNMSLLSGICMVILSNTPR